MGNKNRNSRQNLRSGRCLATREKFVKKDTFKVTADGFGKTYWCNNRQNHNPPKPGKLGGSRDCWRCPKNPAVKLPCNKERARPSLKGIALSNGAARRTGEGMVSGVFPNDISRLIDFDVLILKRRGGRKRHRDRPNRVRNR